MGFPFGRIEELRCELAALPEVDAGSREVSKQQAVKLLARTIFALQRNGYTLETIARLLSEKGFEIAAPTLGNYIRRLRRKRRAGQKDRPVSRADTSATTAKAATNVAAAATEPRPEQRRADFVPREDSDDI